MTGQTCVKTAGQDGFRHWWIRVVSDAVISKEAKNVARVLGMYLNDSGTCWPQRTTLAQDLAVSESAVTRAVKQLEVAGYITRTDAHRGQTTIYTAVLPAVLPERTAERIARKGSAHAAQTSEVTHERAAPTPPMSEERAALVHERVAPAPPRTYKNLQTDEPPTVSMQDSATNADPNAATSNGTGTRKPKPSAQQHRETADRWIGETLGLLHESVAALWIEDWRAICDKDPKARQQLIDAVAAVSRTNNPDAFAALRKRALQDNTADGWQTLLDTRTVRNGVATRGNVAKAILKRIYDGSNVVRSWNLRERTGNDRPDVVANLLSGLNAANVERLAS